MKPLDKQLKYTNIIFVWRTGRTRKVWFSFSIYTSKYSNCMYYDTFFTTEVKVLKILIFIQSFVFENFEKKYMEFHKWILIHVKCVKYDFKTKQKILQFCSNTKCSKFAWIQKLRTKALLWFLQGYYIKKDKKTR